MTSMTISIIGLVISVVSVGVVIFIYIANKKFISKLHNENKAFIYSLHNDKQSSDRVSRVVETYLNFYNSREDTGISALIKAGMRSLENDLEANRALNEIQARVGDHPLGQHRNIIERSGVLRFFRSTSLITWMEDVKKLNND